MKRGRTALVFTSGALAGAALFGLVAALLLVECDESRVDERAADTPRERPGDEGDEGFEDVHGRPGELSERGVGGPCVFSGTVSDEDGRPIAGALVGVRALDVPWIEADLAAEARTDEAGSFTLPGLVEGIPFQVWAFAPGMAVASVDRPSCGARVDLALERGARLVVLARGPDGGAPTRPLAVLIAGDSSWPSRAGWTDEEGRLELEGLPPGRYSVWVGGDGRSALADPVELASRDEAEIELELEDSPPADVRVEDDGGEPVFGAVVLARPRGALLLSLAGATDARGAIRLENLAAVEHDVEVLAPGFLRDDPLILSPGTERTARLRRGARVTGRVLTRERQPVSGAHLEVEEVLGLSQVAFAGGNQRNFLARITEAALAGFPPLRARNGAVLFGPAMLPLPALADRERAPGTVSASEDQWRSREDGTFSLAGLPPGRVVISAFHPELVLETAARLTLEPGRLHENVEVLLRPGATLRVRTIGENGYPLREASLSFYGGGDDEPLASALTGTDGFAEIGGLPGSVRIEAELDGHVPAVVTAEPRPGRLVEITITLPRADGYLRGRLVDKQGFGIGRAAITARSQTRGLGHVLRVESGQHGSFSIEGLGPGDYHVTAEVDGAPVVRVAPVRAGEDIKLIAGDGAGPDPPGPAPEYVTPEMLSTTQTSATAVSSEGDDLGVIAITKTRDTESRATEYGYVDQLPVTGPVPGRGGLPIEIGGGKGNVVVRSVTPGSRVAAAGLKAGDRLVAVDDRKVETPAQARDAIGGAIGSVVMLEVRSEGQSVNIVVQRIRVR